MDDDDNDNARAAAARKGSPFFNTAQTAHYLGISARTLEVMRERGEGPPFRRHGRLIRYHIADIDAWSLANRWDRVSGRQRKPRAARHKHNSDAIGYGKYGSAASSCLFRK